MKLIVQKTFICLLCMAAGHFVLPAAAGQGAGQSAAKSENSHSGGDVNKGEDALAVKGYDVVSYFDQKKPMKGDPKYSYQYNGAKYDFVSGAHLALFTRNPEAYLPQYGGYCAVGTSMGHKADIDPESWAVIDGKLYLNSSKGAQKLFNEDPHFAIKRADQNWAKLK
ncbi:MAG TPA: YHS domain-containing (seleno)protein [Bryobacteraceae bacterium]|nr:YHS domain-containing (seleno)protein [Bryobacteraceae bacterium]